MRRFTSGVYETQPVGSESNGVSRELGRKTGAPAGGESRNVACSGPIPRLPDTSHLVEAVGHSAGVARLRQRREAPFPEPVVPLPLDDLEEDLARLPLDERLEEQLRHAVVADFAVDEHRAAA